jgi:hypothetical protein
VVCARTDLVRDDADPFDGELKSVARGKESTVLQAGAPGEGPGAEQLAGVQPLTS